jgi:multiple sugar transport system substrate-binding protein
MRNNTSSRGLVHPQLPLFLAALFLLGILAISSCNRTATVTVLGEDSSNLNAMKELKGAYEKEAGITIKFQADEFSVANQKANQDFANGTGLYDIVLQYNFSLASFSRNRYVYTINDLNSLIADQQRRSFESNLFQNAWKEVGYYYADPNDPSKGEVAMGYPFAANTMVLVYNRRLFEDPTHQAAYKAKFGEDLKPPATWKQFEQVASYFTAKDNSTAGVCLQGADGGWLYYEWVNFLFGMNGAVMKKERGWQGDMNTPITLDSPEAIEAAKFYLRLKPYNSGDFFSMDAEKQRERMRTGQVAMAIMWSDYIYDLVHHDGKSDDRYGFAPIPGDKSMLAGGIYYINKKSKHPREAFDYVLRVMQQQNQVEHMKRGLCSALKTAYDDPQVQALPYAAALKQSLERGVYMVEAGPDADAISETITQYLQKMWRNELTPEEAIKSAARDIQAKRKEIYQNLQASTNP